MPAKVDILEFVPMARLEPKSQIFSVMSDATSTLGDLRSLSSIKINNHLKSVIRSAIK